MNLRLCAPANRRAGKYSSPPAFVQDLLLSATQAHSRPLSLAPYRAHPSPPHPAARQRKMLRLIVRNVRTSYIWNGTRASTFPCASFPSMCTSRLDRFARRSHAERRLQNHPSAFHASPNEQPCLRRIRARAIRHDVRHHIKTRSPAPRENSARIYNIVADPLIGCNTP